jgi:hypothetical protein
MNHFVYIIESLKDGTYYIGSTQNLTRDWNATIREDRNTQNSSDHGSYFIPKITLIDPAQEFVKTSSNQGKAKNI